MKLLVEADRLHLSEMLSRGEYRIDGAHIRIGCPECGGQNKVHRKSFNGNFECRFCKHETEVKLTGGRG